MRWFRDGVKFQRWGLRWRAGLCAPEIRRHVFLFALANEFGPGSLRLSVQVWRAYGFLEATWWPARKGEEG